LVLHGLFGSQGNWGVHNKAFAETFNVIGVDLRNHGDSPHAPELDYQSMAEDVRLLIESRGPRAMHRARPFDGRQGGDAVGAKLSRLGQALGSSGYRAGRRMRAWGLGTTE
jgi:pimeloyl-ACP methyl ester carboxylesterase